MHQPEIKLHNLTKVFYKHLTNALHNTGIKPGALSAADKIALDGINLTLNSGDIVGIIGRNGAGKSTLLSIIAGIADQTAGDMAIIGKVTAVMTLGIGLRDDLTGRENIYLDGELQGKSRQIMNDLIENIISFAELDDFIDMPVKTYSTGMKSRLAFSMLVEIEPEILIIDEALSAGDIFFAEKAAIKIQEICQKGKIVILVSHSMGSIESMCNRCLWMEAGQIIMDDRPELVTAAYLEKIRDEDEQAESQISHDELSNITEQACFRIMNIELKIQGSDYSQQLFYTKDSFAIEITITRIKQADASLTLFIERLDGLIVHHQCIHLDTHTKDSLTFLIQLTQDSLVLNKGFYQLKLELREKDAVTNHFTRFFEVRNNHMPSGGAPLLHYPAQISLIKEEFSVCSDSIELIAD